MHATTPPAASPTPSHPDCHYGHLTDATALVCFPLPDDAIASSQARGTVVKMRLAMYAGVCAPQLQLPAPAQLPSSEHIPSSTQVVTPADPSVWASIHGNHSGVAAVLMIARPARS